MGLLDIFKKKSADIEDIKEETDYNVQEHNFHEDEPKEEESHEEEIYSDSSIIANNDNEIENDIEESESPIMEEKSAEKKQDLLIRVLEINHIPSKICKFHCNGKEECDSVGYFKTGSFSTDFTTTQIVVEVFNQTDYGLNIFYDRFKVQDNSGYIYPIIHLCFSWEKYTKHLSNDYRLPPNSKGIFDLYVQNTNDYIVSVLYTYKYHEVIAPVDKNTLNGTPNNQLDIIRKCYEEKLSDIEAIYKQKHEDLEQKYDQLKTEYDKLKTGDSYNDDSDEEEYEFRGDIHRKEDMFLLKYEIKEDDDYWRMFSLEEHDTISFNREFDKTKANHNWINIGDPLVTIRIDNVIRGFSAPTIIKSPISGIFEFDKNKIIGYKEEICRIRKYPQDKKTEIIETLEKESIRESLLKKEHKKMLERETLAELIEEGKVFNTYTRKDGNRETIPMDIASAVWNRDGGKCCICGSKENLEFDHIIPVSKGGATTFRNLQLLCENCNRKKSNHI